MMMQLKYQQQQEYRQVLDGQKATRGLGLQEIAGDLPAYSGQSRIKSSTMPPSSGIKAQYIGSSGSPPSQHLTLEPRGLPANTYSMPQMEAAGVRRLPQY